MMIKRKKSIPFFVFIAVLLLKRKKDVIHEITNNHKKEYFLDCSGISNSVFIYEKIPSAGARFSFIPMKHYPTYFQ